MATTHRGQQVLALAATASLILLLAVPLVGRSLLITFQVAAAVMFNQVAAAVMFDQVAATVHPALLLTIVQQVVKHAAAQ